MKKKLISLALTCIILMLSLPASLFAADVIASGECGDNLTWNLYSNGELIISGSGDMWDYGVEYNTPENYEPPYAKVQVNSLKRGADFIELVEFEGDITGIGAYAFSGFSNLKEVYMGDSVTKIGERAFSQCVLADGINLSDSLISIGDYAFANCEFEHISIPPSVETIGSYTFSYCENVKYPPFGVYSDSRYNIKNIGEGAFYNCGRATDSWHTMDIPESVTTIGRSAFSGAPIVLARIGKNVTSIGEAVFTSTSEIEVKSDNPNYCSKDGVLYSKDMKTLVAYPGASNYPEFIIPNGVETIAGGALYECFKIKYIEIPKSMKKIEPLPWPSIEGPFNCYKLRELKILSKDIDLGSSPQLFCEYMDIWEFGSSVCVYGYNDSTVKTFFDTIKPWGATFESLSAPTDGTPLYNFTDVHTSDDYYTPVKYVVDNGLFKGTSDTTFAPDLTMTRSMFVTVLGRYSKADTSAYSTPTFDDVKAGEWYTSYVEWAAANNVVSGYGNGIFGINDNVTIEQACVFLARFADYKDAPNKVENKSQNYSLNDVSDWAMDAVKWAIDNGIYEIEQNNVNPKNPAPRVLVAKMMYAFSEAYK